MGCCLSTLDENKPKPNPNSNSNPLEKNHQFPCVSKSPPRPEEESVKEVLSETPTPKPKPKPKPKQELESEPELESKPELEVTKNDNEPIHSSPKKPVSDTKLNKIEPSTPEEISEVSEMQSVSETISTTTLEDQQQWAIKDSANSGEIHQRRYRSQGQNRNLINNKPNFNANGNGNVNHRRSPVRKRVDPSPPRRKYPGLGQCQGPGLGSGPGRENSTRRSRSPATRNNVGRSPSGRRVGSSPGRVRMVGGPENGRKVDMDEENENGKGKGKGNGIESEMDGPKESLENPLVSLECFIFL